MEERTKAKLREFSDLAGEAAAKGETCPRHLAKRHIERFASLKARVLADRERQKSGREVAWA